MSATVAASANESLGSLPSWDLSHLYAGLEDPQIDKDMAWCLEEAQALETAYKGKVGSIPAGEFGQLMQRMEALSETLYKVLNFANLSYQTALTDPEVSRFRAIQSEKAAQISSHTLFHDLELNQMSDEAVEALFADPLVKSYESVIRDHREGRPHQLSDELEQYLVDASPVDGGWVRLYDETMAEARYEFRGEELSQAEILTKTMDADETVRKEAAQSFGRGLQKTLRITTLVMNTIAKKKEIATRWRKYERPVSSRNKANLVEDEVVDALVSSVQNAYPKLAHRYYALKAKWMGKDKLAYWDRNAPLPRNDDRLIPFEEAKDTVLTAYGDFDPRMANIARRFFDESWIDAPVRPGKAPGAFAAPCVPSVHPYVLLNYKGKNRDVMTMAHELGHGVHQVLASDQGLFKSSTPLTLAETASVFGEMLTFQKLLAQESDPAKRKILLAGKVEDMLNTVVRQIAFHEFETAVHEARKQGELSAEQFRDIWMDVQTRSLGPIFTYDETYDHYWSYVQHFIHVPFYVYAYAFGDCLVNSLYAVYQDADAGFADKYLDMLRAGGSKRHKELLAPFGLDASAPDFWDKGLMMISGLIDQLEALED